MGASGPRTLLRAWDLTTDLSTSENHSELNKYVYDFILSCFFYKKKKKKARKLNRQIKLSLSACYDHTASSMCSAAAFGVVQTTVTDVQSNICLRFGAVVFFPEHSKDV